MLLLVSMTQHCMISVGRNGYLTPLHAHCAMLHIIPHSPTTQRGRKLLHSVAKSPPGTQIACTHLMTPSRSLHNLLHRQTVGLTPQPPTLLLCKPRRGLRGVVWKESSNKALVVFLNPCASSGKMAFMTLLSRTQRWARQCTCTSVPTAHSRSMERSTALCWPGELGEG